MSSFLDTDLIDDPSYEKTVNQSSIIKAIPANKLKVEATSTIVKKNLVREKEFEKPSKAISVNVVQYQKNSSQDQVQDVTEDFVRKFNKHRGNADNVSTAEFLLEKTRKLAGLDSTDKSTYIDIPSARHNLLLLATLNHQDLKMKALRSLIEVLEFDEIKKETAFDIIVLAISLMKQMNRELMQTQLVEEQICICQAYGIVAELIQRHYGEKYLGGITAELKTQLIQTARTLEDLNTHSDPYLHFAVEYALEGIKRLKDDRKELFEILESIYHLLIAAAAYNDDCAYLFSEHLEKAFQGFDIRVTHSWYESTKLFNEIFKSAFKDKDQLAILQFMIKKKAKTLDWKFLFNAIDKLSRIALDGETPAIKEAALMGQKIVNESYPGLIDFIDFNEYDLKTSFKPMIHLKPPVSKDNNVLVRQICIEVLIKIALESPEANLRKSAKQALIQRLKQENDFSMIETIKTVVPQKKSQRIAWLNEDEPFKFSLEKGVLKPLLIEKSAPIQIQSLARHLLPASITQTTTMTSPQNSPPVLEIDSSNQLQVSLLLGNSLGVHPLSLNKSILFGNDIVVNDNHNLKINLEGMKKIYHLLTTTNDIKVLDFSHCQIDKDAFIYLLNSLRSLDIYLLRLPPVEEEITSKLTEILKQNPKIRLTFYKAEDEFLFGKLLLKNDQPKIALDYLNKVLQKAERDDIRGKILYQIGKAHSFLNELDSAEEAWLKSAAINPKSYWTHISLGRLYKQQHRLTEATRHAEQALQIRPEGEAKKLIPSSNRRSTKF